MAIKVMNEEELGKAIKNGESSIEIQGPLADKVYRIKSLGKLAWYAAYGGIAAAVYTALTATIVTETATVAVPAIAGSGATGGAIAGAAAAAAGSAISFTGGGLAVVTTVVVGTSWVLSSLGVAATSTAFFTAIAAGGMSGLSKLRSYKVAEKSKSKLIIRK
jgi:hypothetical protein